MPEIGEKGISYNKGCYIGQEVVAKVKYIGHVNRRFVGLTLSGSDIPELKSPIYKGGKEVGSVTTSLFSPGLERPIALGFVSRTAYAVGTEVEILSEGKRLPRDHCRSSLSAGDVSSKIRSLLRATLSALGEESRTSASNF